MTSIDIEKLTRSLVDQGKIIEAGWVSMPMDPAAPQIQIDEMRMAFFGGAQHLLASIISMLDPGEEPSENDLKWMELITAELREFIKQFEAKHNIEADRDH